MSWKKVSVAFLIKMDVATSVGLTLINRDGDGNPLLEDGESILHTFPDVQLILSSSSDQGVGKLCITEGYG